MSDASAGPPAGPGVDARGVPVIDPTENVKLLVTAEARRLDERITHVEAMAALRSKYEDELRLAESRRIDAIRTVDVAAVQRAAEVASEAVQTLAAQVPITADAVRIALANALNPIEGAIADLRKVQYEQQGQRIANTDSRSSNQWVAATALGVFFGLAGLITTVIVIVTGA